MLKRILIFVGILLPSIASAQGNIYTYPPSGVSGLTDTSTTITSTKNIYDAATLGAELAPAIIAANWTCGAGWDTSVDGTLNKNAGGTGTCQSTVSIAPTAGVTYKIVITVGAVTVASTSSYSIGSTTGIQLLTAATTYTDYLTAANNNNLIISANDTNSRFTIIGVSVKALTDTTGDLTVDGDLTVNSKVYGRFQFLGPNGNTTYPTFGFTSNATGAGFYLSDANTLCATMNGTASTCIRSPVDTASRLWIPTAIGIGATATAPDVFLTRDGAANILGLRNSTNAQTFNIYNTYTDGSNWERAALEWNTNSFRINIDKLGTGTYRNIIFRTSAFNVLTLDSNSAIFGVHAIPNADNGASLGLNTQKWLNLFLGNSQQGSRSKSLTDAGAAVSIERVAVPTNGYMGAFTYFTANSTDGTNRLTTSGLVTWAAADTGGTVTCGTPVVTGLVTAYKRANTLICTFSTAVSTTNCDLQVTCTDNLAGTQTMSIEHFLMMPTVNNYTPQ